jgi:hypothetical protein
MAGAVTSVKSTDTGASSITGGTLLSGGGTLGFASHYLRLGKENRLRCNVQKLLVLG